MVPLPAARIVINAGMTVYCGTAVSRIVLFVLQIEYEIAICSILVAVCIGINFPRANAESGNDESGRTDNL